MSRSGYDDWCSGWELIMWRGAVASALRGARGQAFLKECLLALEAIPTHTLIAHDLENSHGVCAIGAVGKARGLALSSIDPEDRDMVAKRFGIAPAMAAEIAFMNDEGVGWNCHPAVRYARMVDWIKAQIIEERAETRPGARRPQAPNPGDGTA